MRIVHLADPKTANGFYRGVGPMSRLAHRRGHHVSQLPSEGPPSAAWLRDADLLHIHRYSDARAVLLAREAKARGLAVVWDEDDDIGSVPKNTHGYRRLGGLSWERRLQGMQAIFRVADLVTAPSATLAERLESYGASRTLVIENQIPAAYLQTRPRSHEGVTIGWVAAREHRLDADRLGIERVLQRVLDERPSVSVVTVGLKLGLESDRYTRVEHVPFLEITSQTSGFDIGIAPLADIPFNHSRSNIKLKEYAAGGAIWLASPVGPYARMGESDGGRLVPDDGWYEAIVQLLDRPREWRKLAKRGAKWVAGETIEANIDQWESAVLEAVRLSREAGAAASPAQPASAAVD